jgi:hypothetical protein
VLALALPGRRRGAGAGRRSPAAPVSPAIRADGRKGSRSLRGLVASALGERVEAKENGRRRRITKLEAAVKQLVNRAASGDQRASSFSLSSATTGNAHRRLRAIRPQTPSSSPSLCAACRRRRNEDERAANGGLGRLLAGLAEGEGDLTLSSQHQSLVSFSVARSSSFHMGIMLEVMKRDRQPQEGPNRMTVAVRRRHSERQQCAQIAVVPRWGRTGQSTPCGRPESRSLDTHGRSDHHLIEPVRTTAAAIRMEA